MRIIILDFSSGEVHVFPFDKNMETASDFFETDAAEQHNLKETDCQYMVVEHLYIESHE